MSIFSSISDFYDWITDWSVIDDVKQHYFGDSEGSPFMHGYDQGYDDGFSDGQNSNKD